MAGGRRAAASPRVTGWSSPSGTTRTRGRSDPSRSRAPAAAGTRFGSTPTEATTIAPAPRAGAGPENAGPANEPAKPDNPEPDNDTAGGSRGANAAIPINDGRPTSTDLSHRERASRLAGWEGTPWRRCRRTSATTDGSSPAD